MLNNEPASTVVTLDRHEFFLDTLEQLKIQNDRPYDNAVVEATYKFFKTEFVMNKSFVSLDRLNYELADYVHWFNNSRIHGSLGYLFPVQFKDTISAK